MPPIRFGIIGLGTAGTAIVPSVARHPSYVLAAVADLDDEVLGRFKQDYPDAKLFGSAEALAESSDVDALFIATPTQLHTEHVLAAINSGKHVITEKPVATRLQDADAMIAAAEKRGVVMMVGHSFSYETPIREIRKIVKSGELGALKMLHNWYFTDWMYRPRNPEELDTSLGGGVTFRQGSHQFDLIRLIAGGLVRSVRATTGRWDPSRPSEGSHTVFLDFEDGVVATAVYNGYDRFSTAELTFGVGEGGQPVDPAKYATARHALAKLGGPDDEAALKRQMRYGGRTNRAGASQGPRSLPFYGLTLVSCELGDIRQSPDGLFIYGPDEKREVLLEKGKTGRDAILDEFYEAVVKGKAPVHDGRWGKANLEVCLAVIDSARERKEVFLSHQKAVND
ncbi:MAG: Gfo/Idh/MocA family oxidoreductase [Dehalococcoidia bacterium]